MTPALEKEGPVASTSSRNVQTQAQRTQEPSWKGKRQSQFTKTLPTRAHDPQIGTFSNGQCFQYGPKSYGIHRKIEGKDEQDFSTQMIDEIKFVKSSIDVEIGKFDAKLN
ncbi:hypothetical protein O181_130576 [Austropuccinia psidii MF-1]|uniref:Uncharacterized protein n=1 Tax=Austropuccinia psidii MF-1 TaxID=1389203 RepID=A0A9Q3L315_9BASI|nr:hypothetical protein [Austropuccinia psidii MF-1]